MNQESILEIMRSITSQNQNQFQRKIQLLKQNYDTQLQLKIKSIKTEYQRQIRHLSKLD